MVSSSQFTHELHTQMERATKRGADQLQINSVQLHLTVSGHPGRNHGMLTCSAAMQNEMKPGDLIVGRPEGANLTVRYLLPRGM